MLGLWECIIGGLAILIALSSVGIAICWLIQDPRRQTPTSDAIARDSVNYSK
jgi:hypothetical protein